MQNSKSKKQSYSSNFKDDFKKRLYVFVLRLIKFIESLPKKPVCNVISNQLLRSGTSILANFIEAQSASSKRDFVNFFNHSLKSANESKMWLSLLKDTNNCDKKENEHLLGELQEIAKIIASSILTIKGKRIF